LRYLFVDFESRSYVELSGNNSVGLYNYMSHPTTEMTMCAYWYGGIGPEKPDVKMWKIWTGEDCPKDLRGYLEDPEVPIVAYNSSFERFGFGKKGYTLPTSRFQDPQPSARMLSLPADLDAVSDILGLDRDLAKDKRGSKLIDLFCFPVIKKAKKPTKKNPVGVPAQIYYNDWISHPAEWEEFAEYCRQDVVAEREILRRLALLKVFPLPAFERAVWIFDQKVNDRGIHVPRQLVTNALALGERAKKLSIGAMNEITHLENSNSRDQLLPWCQERGYEDDSLEKDAVRAALEFGTKLTPDCRKVLEARRAASSTTYKKLAAILRQLCPDDRLRGQFIYMGSARCGRWSGNAVQMHNMARPGTVNGHNFEDEDVVDKARTLIYGMDFDGIIKEFGKSTPEETDYGSVLTTIKNIIRTVFDAEDGKRLNVCDLNAIETRMSAYLCQCEKLNAVFIPRPGKPNGNCPYIDFAADMNGMTYDQLDANYHSLDKAIKAVAKKMRQDMKPAVLGCVYRLKGGSIETDWKTGRLTKTGLLDYAAKMGINLTEEFANNAVKFFRERYFEIRNAWYDLERIVVEVLEGERVKREWGPGGIVKFDKIVFTDHGKRRTVLRIQLPSGRYLHYIDAHLEERKMPWQNRDGSDFYKKTLIYAGTNQDTHQWEDNVQSHGGKILENIVQGTSRDVLALKLMMFEAILLWVVAHVHDEGVTETDDSPLSPGLPEMDAIMRAAIDWLPGFLLGCDGFEDQYYHK
jgi:DNA polymerase bacteriophage-type